MFQMWQLQSTNGKNINMTIERLDMRTDVCANFQYNR